MALSQRDTRIAYGMMFLVVAYLLWLFGIEPVYRQYNELVDDLNTQEEQFRKNQKTLSQAKDIEAGYKRVEAQFPPDVEDKDPGDVFIEEVTELVTKIVGQQPGVKYPTPEDIKGAKGYQMLSFPVTLQNVEFKPVSELLKALDQKGYLVLNATLNRASNLDKTDLQLVEITLGRIVKPEEEPEPVKPVRPFGPRPPTPKPAATPAPKG